MLPFRSRSFRLNRSFAQWFVFSLLVGGPQLDSKLRAASLPSEWKYYQDVSVTNAGLVEVDLPIPTLDAARSQLEDLRLLDIAGQELAYLIDRSLPKPTVSQNARAFQAALAPQATMITLETGVPQPIDRITLVTPASTFLKAVQVEGSRDRARWELLAKGNLIFRQANGASQLDIPIEPASWPHLRLTVDDQRSEPIPFSGARVQAASVDPPTVPLPVSIAERTENGQETRLLLRLPGAHLQVARLRIQTVEPLFTRGVTVATRRILENAIEDVPVAQGVIYRLAVEGQPATSNLIIPVETRPPTADLILTIRNYDSPPLRIDGMEAERRSVKVYFHAGQPGAYRLLTGNNQVTVPQYDLADLANQLRGARVSSCSVAPLSNNPAFRQPEALPAIQDMATPLNVTAWKYRKLVQLSGAGVQQLDLDPDVLSHAQPGLQDLRIVQGEKQIPYVLEHTSITRSVRPVVSLITDPKQPTVSRWTLALPLRALPITRVACTSQASLFERQVLLYEQAPDERGDRYQRVLGRTSWVRKPGRQIGQLEVLLSERPLTLELFLETDNGDNPPLTLEQFQADYLVSRVLFKSSNPSELFLYYGNREAGFPRYDLGLVAPELQSASKQVANLGSEQVLTKSAWGERSEEPTIPRAIFWVVLVGVVVLLLLVIVRLLPRERTAPPPASPT